MDKCFTSDGIPSRTTLHAKIPPSAGKVLIKGNNLYLTGVKTNVLGSIIETVFARIDISNIINVTPSLITNHLSIIYNYTSNEIILQGSQNDKLIGSKIIIYDLTGKLLFISTINESEAFSNNTFRIKAYLEKNNIYILKYLNILDNNVLNKKIYIY